MIGADAVPAAPGWAATQDGWGATTASARGSAHRSGQPNQDAAGVAPLRGGGMVAVVADGHGGTTYARSHVGARLAVQSALSVVAADPDAALPALFARIVDRWRQAVLAHVAVQPESTDRVPGALGSPPVGGGRDADPYRSYGTTLLVAVLRGDRLGVAQLGDGDVVVRSASRTVRPVPGDARLVADVTTSLCLPTAEADVRFAELPAGGADAPELVLLATDGLGKSFEDPDWWSTTAEDYASLLQRLGPEVFRQRLEGWLADSASVAGDDATVALVCRDPHAVGTGR